MRIRRSPKGKLDRPPLNLLAMRATILGLGAIFLFLIASNSLIRVANDANLALGADIWPGDSDQVLLGGALRAQSVDWTKNNPEQVSSVAGHVRKLDPLDEWPFILQALVLRDQGDIKKATELLRIAKRRNPRSFIARIQMIQTNLTAAKLGPALDDIVAAIRLRPDQPELTQALLVIDNYPEARDRMIAAVREVPTVHRKLLLAASARSDKTRLVRDLLPKSEISEERRWELIGNLAADGNYELAFEIWRKERPSAEKNLVFDGDFDGKRGPAPFAWQLQQSGDLVTSIVREPGRSGSGLEIEYFGNVPLESAAQITLLAAGIYRLSATGQAIDSRAGLGKMRWTIGCEGQRKALATLTFDASAPSIQRQSASFEVPGSNCAAQKLTLTAIQSENRDSFTFQFSYIHLEKRQ